MSMIKKVLVIGAVCGLLYVGVRQTMPLGIRNNNPLNIKFSEGNKWEGQTGQNRGFCTFSSSKYGIRAAARLLNNYMTKNSLTSVTTIITKWAPGSDNNPTKAYVDFVAKYIGVNAADNNLTSAHIPALIAAMTRFENGIQPYSMSAIKAGVELAGIKL
ncbi:MULTISPECIES: structural protein P5 [Aliivibrio]|uniref:Structural protein P5 n=1 Tax=Aliivibrio finisterrensis TaxID=511998 RepID=A0A4Q5KWI4_9GAMM|nr:MULTISPECIES: structural protein P5 [Aliivibrio]MDD9178423.1 structural protein P5 [Aliivibrio sp. A6]RYU53318.1 structural protein P5 [Aliivibrio finisterrensis]RYU65825.1 structural protein P5 [Aliivibrio finisterrensis]RYU86616.1 structural protein P5 [Aliivibrio finisterrensis]